jgi:hypothetical protein
MHSFAARIIASSLVLEVGWKGTVVAVSSDMKSSSRCSAKAILEEDIEEEEEEVDIFYLLKAPNIS